jgi:hypothetical protein
MELLLGIAAAIGASSLYSLGIALQAMDAKEAPAGHHLRPALVLGLVRRVRWLTGTGLSILGWPLQVVALMLAPLVVVQPALAFGLVVLMFLGERMLDEHAGRYEHLAMAAIILGVIGAALFAPPRSSTTGAQPLTITLVLVGLGLVSLLPYILRTIGHPHPELTMVCAGVAFGWSGVATKLASDDLAAHHLWAAAAWGVSTGAASAVGVLSEMSALQARPAIQVAPVVFVTQTVVPVVLALAILGENLGATPLEGLPLILSLAVTCAGAAALARSPLLLALMEEDLVSEPSVSADSPSETSQPTIRSNPSSDVGEPASETTSTSPARIGR